MVSVGATHFHSFRMRQKDDSYFDCARLIRLPQNSRGFQGLACRRDPLVHWEKQGSRTVELLPLCHVGHFMVIKPSRVKVDGNEVTDLAKSLHLANAWVT